MMAAPVKSPLRAEIEAEVIGILSRFDRPMSAAEIFVRTETAEDRTAVVRIIGHMREAGTIVRDVDIPVGELGGMPAKAKGARAVASYRLPTEEERAERAAQEVTDPVEEQMTRGPRALDSGRGSPQPPAAVKDSLTAVPSANSAREEDPAEYLDSAGSSANGDESASPWSRILADDNHYPERNYDDRRWETDVLQTCETSREFLILLADQLLATNPVWAAAREVDHRIQKLAENYV